MAAKSPWHGSSRVELHIGAGGQGFLLPGVCAHGVFAENHVDLAAQPGQATGGGCGSVPAPQYGHGFAPEEHAVTGGAVGQAPAQEALGFGKGQFSGGGPHGQDHGACGVGSGGGFYGFGRSGQAETSDLGLEKGGACGFCTCQHGFCQLGAGCAGDAWIVFHPGGDRHLPARCGRLQQERGETLPRAVKRRPTPGRSCANDHELIIQWDPLLLMEVVCPEP